MDCSMLWHPEDCRIWMRKLEYQEKNAGARLRSAESSAYMIVEMEASLTPQGAQHGMFPSVDDRVISRA